MKKIFTTIASLCLFIAATAQTQTDLSIEYYYYSSGQVFSKDSVKTKFIIKNVGTTMFHTGDTLYVNARLNGDLYDLDLLTSSASPIVLNKMLHSGDTIHYDPGYISGSQTLAYFQLLGSTATTLDVCMIVWGKGKASVTSAYGGDINTANNTVCVTYDPNSVAGITSNSLQANDLLVFPNPAYDNVMFEVKNSSKIAHLRVTDVNGRLINESFDLSSKIMFNTSTWDSGVYFYQLIDSNGKMIVNKFSVTK